MNCGSRKGWEAHKAANTRCCKWCEPYDPRLANPKKEVVVRAVRKKAAPKPRKKVTDRDHKSIRIGRPPAKCGSPAGYAKHRRAKEAACQPCLDAIAQYKKDHRAKQPPKPPRTPAVCGTAAGYMKNYRAKEKACGPCNTANNKKSRDSAARKKAATQ